MAHASIDTDVAAVEREPGLGELSLDPADWESFRRLGHRAIDDVAHYLSTLRERPAWTRVPESVRESFGHTLPMDGETPERVYDEVLRNILPFPAGNIHPRFWGWIIGTGTSVGVLAELLTATMNTPVPGFEQSAYYVERQVLEWLRELMMMPSGATGLLVSGGSAANLIGLTVARNTPQARMLERLVDAHPQLEKLAPMQLNVVTFRYWRPHVSDAALDALNAELVIRLQESGVAAPSGTVVRGRTALRVASVNHRSRSEDFEILVREAVAIGDRLAAAFVAQGFESLSAEEEADDASRQR